MVRQGNKQRFIKTKVKHRRKLNTRYDPSQWIRLIFTETVPKPMADFLTAWAKNLLEVCDGK